MAWLVYSHRGVAKRLVLDLEPAGAATAEPFATQPVGHLVDGSGLPSRTAGVTVTASKVTGSGTLGGTLTAVTDAEGIFAFSDLELDTVTTGVTLQFTAGGLVAVTSAPFDVTAGSGTAYALTAEATSYAWSGAAVTLRWGRRVAAAPVAYTWTPAAATLRWGRRLTAAGTTYTWNPQAATLTYTQLAFRLSPSSYIAAGGGTATTARLTAPAGKTSGADFQAGRLSDDTNPLATLDLGSGKYTELEWAVMATAAVAVDDVYEFRVVSGAGALDTYSVTPSWTVSSAEGTYSIGASPASYAWTVAAAALTYYTPNKSMTASPASYTWTVAAATLTGPGSSLYPNKPSGFTSSREIGFAMAVPGSYGADRSIPGSDNFHMIYDVDYGGGEQSIMRVADATAPSGDGYAWRWHFIPGTYGDGYGRGNIYTNLSSETITELYTCIDIKWASDYPWHAVSNKFLWWTPDQLLVQSQETVRWLHGEHLSGSQWLDDIIGPLNGATLVTYENDAISLGDWHKIEVLLDRNAQTFRIWMDGSLKLHATGVTMSTNVFDEVFHTGHRGGGGETLATDGYYYIDHLHYAWAP